MAHEKPSVRKWEALRTFGDSFSPRTGHTVVFHEGYVYVFGGTDSEQRQNDLHKLKISSGKWTKLDCKSDYRFVPQKRSGAKGVVHDGKFYIFGGYDGRGGNYFNDIHYFDFNSETWHYIHVSKSEETPAPRTDHSMVLYQNKFYVFGGYDGRNRLNDLCCFDIEERSWKSVENKGDSKPCCRFAHSAVVHQDAIYVFGGWNGMLTLNSLWKFDFISNVWTSISLGNENQPNFFMGDLFHEPLPPSWPAHRYRHTAVCYGAMMIVFGGVDKAHKRFSKIECFNFESGSWSIMQTSGTSPASRTFHPALVIKDRMYIFGGYDGEIRLNDVSNVFIGPLSVLPLKILAGDVVRAGYKKMKLQLAVIPPSLKSNLFWRKDAKGVLRGRAFLYMEHDFHDRRIVCHIFNPQTEVDEQQKPVVLDAPCLDCNLEAQEHEKMTESSRMRLSTSVASVRNIFRKQLNIYSDAKSISSPKKMFAPSAVTSILSPLTGNELNIRKNRTRKKKLKAKIVFKGQSQSNSGNGCSSPTENEPEARSRSNLSRNVENPQAMQSKKRRRHK